MGLAAKLILYAAVILVATGAQAALANPDIWVRTGATYHFEDQKVSAITFEWRFDAFFSSRAIGTYDHDKSGVLETAEVEYLRGKAFDPLGESDYYTHIWIGGEKRGRPQIEKFTAEIDGKVLVYRFTVPVTPPADPATDTIIVSLYDRDIVIDFRLFEKNFLLVEGAMRPECRFRVARGKGAQSGHAQPITLSCGG